MSAAAQEQLQPGPSSSPAHPFSGKSDRRRLHSATTTSSGEITDCGRGYWTYGENRVEDLGGGLSQVTRPDGSAFLITRHWSLVTCHICRRH